MEQHWEWYWFFLYVNKKENKCTEWLLYTLSLKQESNTGGIGFLEYVPMMCLCGLHNL